MQLTENERRIRWHCCHRGMLELDLLLLAFFDKQFVGLSASDKALFTELLEFTDPELLAVIMGYEQPANTAFIPLLLRIRDAC
jgi:antitoxin CptB